MSPFCPAPNDVANLIGYAAKYGFADHVAMVVGPAAQDRIELQDEMSSSGLSIGFNHLPHLLQHSFDTFSRWFGE